MEQKIYLAPLQGFTDFVYRKAWRQVFNEADAYFVPYVSLKNDTILRKYERELLPANNLQQRVVPQALVKNSHELLQITKLVKDFGYSEININLGCPYPMVTRGGRGAALLPKPEELKIILDDFFEHNDLELSLKLRAGLNSAQELEKILPVLNAYPLKEIILHPRIAKQLYKGQINDESFALAQNNLKHRLVFNGDIFSAIGFMERKNQFPECNYWMLGRGVLMNPFLPSELKGVTYSDDERRHKLRELHDFVLEDYLKLMDNEGNALNKMQQFWFYFSHSFSNQKKAFKAVKKSKNMRKYREAAASIFREE